jgi:hypothetical protein
MPATPSKVAAENTKKVKKVLSLLRLPKNIQNHEKRGSA